jgi:hypothetical protein
MAGVRLAALAATLLAAHCSDAANRFDTHERPVEARTEGELDLHYGWLDPGTLVVVAPFHAAAARDQFSHSRLDALSHAPAPTTWVALTLWRFEGDAALDLGRDGVALKADSPRGSLESIAPSKLLAAVNEPGPRATLAAQLGAGELPRLAKGQSLQLLVALPGDVQLHDLSNATAATHSGVVTLTKTRAAALSWDEFRTQPTKERFTKVLAAVASPPKSAREENHRGSSEPPSK